MQLDPVRIAAAHSRVDCTLPQRADGQLHKIAAAPTPPQNTPHYTHPLMHCQPLQLKTVFCCKAFKVYDGTNCEDQTRARS